MDFQCSQCYSYDLYKRSVSVFWNDQHHMQVIHATERKRRKNRKHSKTYKEVTSEKMESILNRVKTRNIAKSKKTNQIHFCHQRFFIHSKTLSNESSVPQDVTSNLMPATEFKSKGLKHKRKKREIVKPGRGLLMYIRSVNSQPQLKMVEITSINSFIRDVCGAVNIPVADVFVLYNGSTVSRAVLNQLKSYDTIDVLVKAKGGMLDDHIHINEHSSVKTVTGWLKCCIGLSDDDIEKSSDFKYLDGEAVCMYTFEDLHELTSHFKIPVGSARKMLIMRDISSFQVTFFQSEIAKWSPEDVSTFFKDTIKIQDTEIQNICMHIVEERVDGIVFLSYSCPKEMQIDLHSKEIYGMIYKKVFLKRDNFRRDEAKRCNIEVIDNVNGDEEPKMTSNQSIIPAVLNLENPNKRNKSKAVWFNKNISPKEEELSTCESHMNTKELFQTDQTIQTSDSKSDLNESEHKATGQILESYLDVHQDLDGINKIIQTNSIQASDKVIPQKSTEEQGGAATIEFSEESKTLSLKVLENVLPQTNTENQGDAATSEFSVESSIPSLKKTINSEMDQNAAIDKNLRSYLQNTLNLYPVTNSEGQLIECNLHTFHCNWTKPNELEKKVLFIIITNKHDYSSNDARKTLWDRIRKNTHCWYKHFNNTDKQLFEISKQKEDCLLYNAKPISLPQSPLKMRFIMEKSVKEMCNFTNVFLLIAKNLLQSEVCGYNCDLENPNHSKKKMQYLFGFDSCRHYWLFNPSDYAYGFRKSCITRKLCGNIIKHTENTDKEPEDEIPVEHNSSENVTVDQTVSESKHSAGKINLTIQKCRNFKADDTAIQYHEGWVMSTAEHDGAVAFRCFEFKFISDALLNKGCSSLTKYIILETIRFSCGCLNARKNGTLIFGIGDTHKHQYRHGEVVGFPVTGFQEDFRVHLTESLRGAIQCCFESHHWNIVSKCVGNPVFVEVISELPSVKTFVVEIDIEPCSYFCKQECFKINRSKLSGIGNTKHIENEPTLYVRENVGTVKKVKKDLDLFIRTEFNDIIQKRVHDEKQKTQSVSENPELPMDKLRRHMCKGSDKFNQSIWPILILNKPTDKQKQSEQWVRSLKFIKRVNFHAVFDFDENSNIDGLCAMLRKEEESILLDEDIFREYSGKKLDLAIKLGIPHDMKTVWIFSNGRSDVRPPKMHYGGYNWTNNYSAGIRDAVIFYSQQEVIPMGRALVIVLLLSSDFDGLIETFREIVVRFGWNQILLIAVDDIIERFVSEFKEMEDKIYECGIYGKGLTWEHVNSTFLEITGCEEEGSIYIITSSGVSVPADEKFVESLSDIHILSSKQCESKKYKTKQEKIKFASDKEIQFYKGNKVDWFNFHFQDQVLKRHCFDRLKHTVGNILLSNQKSDRESKIISTVIISHEPGAGGSTLARHILWEFRTQYRCAIVKKITDRTAKNVLSLWQYKEKNHLKPLLLLVDDLQLSDYSFEDLMRQIYIEYRTNLVPEGLVCCFLLCQREDQIPDSSTLYSRTSSNTGDVIEPLKQQLTEKEVEWMNEKYETMERTESDYRPEYLLSFIVLREGFNRDYIKGTIKRFLTKLNFSSNEFELLEYTSLLSTYAPTSKRGPSAFIPLECCDELMGLRTVKSLSWEHNMSDVLKIFLIVEPKETASGMQLRMAHPALAEAVLEQIIENKKESLSSLTLRFLDSSIIQSQTHARGMVVDFTKEMLKRRLKEEYNDNRTTLFSPLIEEICKREKWDVAVNVLIKGLEKFKDSFIAQALARLSVKYGDFENAVQWARQAIEMSVNNKTACSFSHNTLATVLEDKFKYDTKTLNMVTPQYAVKYISIILDALDHFLEASRLKIGTEDHLLYPIQGVIKTIITCAKFIRDHVQFSTEVNIREYLTCEDYVPEEIREVWGNLRHRFLTFANQGEKAFAKVEECLCFNTTFYAHDTVSSCNKRSKEHRLYRNLHYKYPDMFNDFRGFFGATSNECPRSEMPEVMNNWHRRRLLQLGGNTYMNICNILLQTRKRSKPFSARSKPFSAEDAVKECVQIKDHLIKITDRHAKDLANLVSVNLVLGLLAGRNRDSTDKMVEYCKQIMKMKRGYEDMASFFICILMWPSNQIDVKYDDDLFYESLKYLHREKDIKHGRTRGGNYGILKEEKNITQATTQFFLSKGPGFKSICHRFDIFFREQPELEFDNAIWANQRVQNNLKRLKGQLKICKGKCYIRMINPESSSERDIEIRKIRNGKREFLSEEEVYFYLGFSIAGPIAYDVKPVRHENIAASRQTVPRTDKVEEFLSQSEEMLKGLLNQIIELNGKRKNGRKLKAKEVDLVNYEADIKTALEIKMDQRDDFYPY